MPSIQEIAATLRSIAAPGMKPKTLRDKVREQYPEARKKEIARAAFYALTDPTDGHSGASAELHEFALSERGPGDDAVAEPKDRKAKKRHKSR